MHRSKAILAVNVKLEIEAQELEPASEVHVSGSELVHWHEAYHTPALGTLIIYMIPGSHASSNQQVVLQSMQDRHRDRGMPHRPHPVKKLQYQ